MASFNLIASFGAFAKSCLVPRYCSVVCTEEWPSASESVQLATGSPAQFRRHSAQIMGRDVRQASADYVRVQHLPHDLLAHSSHRRFCQQSRDSGLQAPP